MASPIALQLYTIREELAVDFEGHVRKIADMGYVGVEPAGFPGTTPEKAGKLFRELGLVVPSAHTPMPVGEARQQTLDAMNSLGSKRIVSGLGPNDFKTMDLIEKSCDKFNEASRVYLPVIVILLCFFALSSILRKNEHYRNIEKPALVFLSPHQGYNTPAFIINHDRGYR